MTKNLDKTVSTPELKRCGANDSSFLLKRRQFLFGTGAAVTLLAMPSWMRGMPGKVYAQVAEYESQLIGQLSALTENEPMAFNYPWDHPNSANFLMKLNGAAGGGVGPDENVVAFNSFCTHQGGPLTGTFKTDIGIAGPCPLHWTTFDLHRHGMVVSGHATIGLPQILLETNGDDIYAMGVMGLIYGYHNNLVNPNG